MGACPSYLTHTGSSYHLPATDSQNISLASITGPGLRLKWLSMSWIYSWKCLMLQPFFSNSFPLSFCCFAWQDQHLNQRCKFLLHQSIAKSCQFYPSLNSPISSLFPLPPLRPGLSLSHPWPSTITSSIDGLGFALSFPCVISGQIQE